MSHSNGKPSSESVQFESRVSANRAHRHHWVGGKKKRGRLGSWPLAGLANFAKDGMKMRFTQAASLLSVGAFRGQSSYNSTGLGRPLSAIAALSAGVSFCCYFSSPELVYSEKYEEVRENIALNPDEWVRFRLHEVAKVSHNSQLFRFTFNHNAKLGLDVASCILTRAPLGQDSEGKTKYVIRPYTPISDPDSNGYFDLLIKVYPEGKMSQHLAHLKPGDFVEVKGPIEKFKYTPNMKKHIGMIAGGTGITPMLQVAEAILKNPEDNTQVSLIYGNVSPDDILLKQKLDTLSAAHPNFKVFYTVDNPSKQWHGGIGYVSQEMSRKGLPAPSEDTFILVCGPPGMMEHVSGEKGKDRSQGELTGMLKELGYTEDMVYKF